MKKFLILIISLLFGFFVNFNLITYGNYIKPTAPAILNSNYVEKINSILDKVYDNRNNKNSFPSYDSYLSYLNRVIYELNILNTSFKSDDLRYSIINYLVSGLKNIKVSVEENDLLFENLGSIINNQTGSTLVNVYFDGNGGGGHTPISQSIQKGQSLLLMPSVPENTISKGTFVGWSIDKNNYSTLLSTGTIINTGATYYAVWLCDIQKFVDGKTSTGKTLCGSGNTIGDLGTSLSKSGFVFAGWYTSGTGGTRITSDTKVTSNPFKMYAQRQENHYYKILFDLNYDSKGIFKTKNLGGNGIIRIGQLPEPTRDGYKLIGWFKTQSGSGGTRVYDTTVVKDNFTLYAKWLLNSEIHSTGSLSSCSTDMAGYINGCYNKKCTFTNIQYTGAPSSECGSGTANRINCGCTCKNLGYRYYGTNYEQCICSVSNETGSGNYDLLDICDGLNY